MPKVYGRKIRAVPSKSLWPGWIARLFDAFREIPWISFAAVGTGCGVVILFFYFWSIDHFPSDIASVVALGATTAAYSMAVLIAAAICFAAPAMIYREYVAADSNSEIELSKVFTRFRLVFLQLGGLGAFFCWAIYNDYRNCRTSVPAFNFLSIPFLAVGLITLLLVLTDKRDGKSLRARALTAVSVSVMGGAPLIALSPLLPLLYFPWVDGFVILITLWLIAIIANAGMAIELPGKAMIIIGLLCMGWAYILLPFVFFQPYFFPTFIATEVGVRSQRAQVLYVPQKTCDLIGIAISRSGSVKPRCQSDDWNEITALVLSNVGSRWLIEVDAGGAQQAGARRIRLTIPGNDVQMRNDAVERAVNREKSSCS
jgi:hypothetical protein